MTELEIRVERFSNTASDYVANRFVLGIFLSKMRIDFSECSARRQACRFV
jgi:hypothetical protein